MHRRLRYWESCMSAHVPYDPIISQLKRAVASGRGAAAALAEARRTKLTKHHPELAQLVEAVRRIH